MIGSMFVSYLRNDYISKQHGTDDSLVTFPRNRFYREERNWAKIDGDFRIVGARVITRSGLHNDARVHE